MPRCGFACTKIVCDACRTPPTLATATHGRLGNRDDRLRLLPRTPLLTRSRFPILRNSSPAATPPLGKYSRAGLTVVPWSSTKSLLRTARRPGSSRASWRTTSGGSTISAVLVFTSNLNTFQLEVFVYRHHVPTKIAPARVRDNRLAAAADGSTSSGLARQSDSLPRAGALLGRPLPAPLQFV